MRLAPVDFLVGLAERAHAALYMLDNPERHTPLLAAGVCANWAFYAPLRHGAVAVGYVGIGHHL